MKISNPSRFLSGLVFTAVGSLGACSSLVQIGPRIPAEISSQALSETQVAERIGALFASTMRPQAPVKRPVFAKSHGCLKAKFIIEKQLSEELKVGVFQQAPSYDAWLRFSNDGPPRADNQTNTRGMAIKLVGVSGKKLLEGEEDAVTQDFVMQNHPVFFSDTAQDFLDFVEAGFDATLKPAFDAKHPETERILEDMKKNLMADPLDGKYWTPTPYKLGKRAMKYMVKPCVDLPLPIRKPMVGASFLRANLVEHIRQSRACFGFYVQLQADEATMPLDRATVKWPEDKKENEFQKVATLEISQGQDVDAPVRDKLCESMSFTGWHALPEHEPLGSINRARKIVYKSIADLRRGKNGVPVVEPLAIGAQE